MSKQYTTKGSTENRYTNQNDGLILDTKDNINAMLSIDDPKHVGTTIDSIKLCVEKQICNISATQLRNIYSEAVDCDDITKLQFFRPKLAYIAARSASGSNVTKSLAVLLDKMIIEMNERIKEDASKEGKLIENFKTSLESIVAFHKFYEVKEKTIKN